MSQRKPVLIVEDDQDIRSSLKDALENEGFDVMEAGHGKEALDCLLRADPLPGLIILDLMMSVMDGRTFLETVHREYSDRFSQIPVIVSTAASRGSSEELPPNRGILRKPVDLDKLLNEVQRYCA